VPIPKLASWAPSWIVTQRLASARLGPRANEPLGAPQNAFAPSQQGFSMPNADFDSSLPSSERSSLRRCRCRRGFPVELLQWNAPPSADAGRATGNAFFDAPEDALGQLTSRVERVIAETLGRHKPSFVSSVLRLMEVAASDHFERYLTDDVRERCVTFLPGDRRWAQASP